MSRIITQTGITNKVAIILKSRGVTTVNPAEPQSKLASRINLVYDDTRRLVLRDHTWNFAEKEISLAADGQAPIGKYERRFRLPPDYIRIAWLGDEQDPETDYKIKGKYIYCNLDSPTPLGYIYDHNAIEDFDPNFLECLVLRLAYEASYDMTGNANYRSALMQEYKEMLPIAATIDGQESKPTHRIRRSKWRDAKYHRGGHGLYYNGRVVT